MVSLPGPRSPKRSIHSARSKLRGHPRRLVAERLGHPCRRGPTHRASRRCVSSTGRSSSRHSVRTGLEGGIVDWARAASLRACGRRRPRGPTTPGQVDPGLPRALVDRSLRHGDVVDDGVRGRRVRRRWRRIAPCPKRPRTRWGRCRRASSATGPHLAARSRRGGCGLPQTFASGPSATTCMRSSTTDSGPPGSTWTAAGHGRLYRCSNNGQRPDIPRLGDSPRCSIHRAQQFRPRRPQLAPGVDPGHHRRRRRGAARRRRGTAPQARQVIGRPPLKLDHVARARRRRRWVARPGPVALREGAVQIADQSFGMGELGERARGPSGGRPRGG